MQLGPPATAAPGQMGLDVTIAPLRMDRRLPKISWGSDERGRWRRAGTTRQVDRAGGEGNGDGRRRRRRRQERRNQAGRSLGSVERETVDQSGIGVPLLRFGRLAVAGSVRRAAVGGSRLDGLPTAMSVVIARV